MEYEDPDALPLSTRLTVDSDGNKSIYEQIDQSTEHEVTAAVYEQVDQGTRSTTDTAAVYDSLQSQYTSLDPSTTIPPAPPAEYGKLHIYGNMQNSE